MNSSNISESNNSNGHPAHDYLSSETAAVSYAVIFVLALVGNILVIATLIQNKKMRTVTNVFLLNLSFSDLLLAVFCMPFNIIPMLMRNFVFGPTVCYLSRYFQGLNRQRHRESIRSLENSSFRKFLGNGGDGLSSTESTPHKRPEQRCMIRHSNPERNRAAKVRVIKMLFAVVIEYFICWTPLYACQTWRSFHEPSLRQYFSNLTLSLVFMLAYLSSACNPVTYCLMNKSFRQSFRSVLNFRNCCNVVRAQRHFSNRSEHYNSLKLQTTRCSLLKNNHAEMTQEHV